MVAEADAEVEFGVQAIPQRSKLTKERLKQEGREKIELGGKPVKSWPPLQGALK